MVASMKELEKFTKLIRKVGFDLADVKELFIIEEMTPFFVDNTLKQDVRVRLIELKDYKKKVLDVIDKAIDEQMEEANRHKSATPEYYERIMAIVENFKYIKKELRL